MASPGATIRGLIHACTAAVSASLILLPTFIGWTGPTGSGGAPTPAPEAPRARADAPVTGSSATFRADALATLPAVVDAAARTLIARQHAPGAAVAIVHDGQVIALRAYGTARLETDTAVDAERTLFRVGSVTKPLTAAAVLTLVDQNRLDLFRDVRVYLPGFAPSGVTAHHLLTHTAGFDEQFAGSFTRAPEDLQPLSDYLRRSVRVVRPPGLVYSYANTNYAVAGWLLEHLSGQPYAEAMEARLFRPLGMFATTARQPPADALATHVARGYAWDGARYRALPFRYTNASPGGAVSTTAADMSRFMLAVLGDGPLDGMRVLSATSRTAFLHPQFRRHPRLPGVTYGFREWRTHGRVLLHHDGTLEDHVAVLLLDPDNAFGMFVASNSNPGIGNHLVEPVLAHLYGAEPAASEPVALPATGHAAEVAGVYLDLNRTRHDLSSVRALMPMLQARIATDADAITWNERRWVEVEPYVFRAAGVTEPLVFRPDGTLQTWTSTYERIGWRRQTPAQLGFAAACLLAFLAWVSSWRRIRPAAREERVARASALFVAVANLAFAVWFVVSIRRLGNTTPLPASDVAFLTLGIAAALTATLLPGFAVTAWRDGWWTRGRRAGFTAVAVSGVGFAAWLNAWNLLGYKY